MSREELVALAVEEGFLGLTMIAKFMEFEQRYFRSDSPPVQSSALVTLADLFMHRLKE